MTTQQTLLQYAFKLLGRQRYSIAQIRKKLEGKKLGTPEDIESVIIRLKELQYLDDATFAQLYLEDAVRRKPQGLKMLRNGLMKRGVPAYIIAKAFQQKPLDELQIAQIAMQKKQRTFQSIAPEKRLPALKRKEKLYRFLLSRGFSQGTVMKVLNGGSQ